jgi:hypothetical protein
MGALASFELDQFGGAKETPSQVIYDGATQNQSSLLRDRYTQMEFINCAHFSHAEQVRFIVEMLAPTSLGTEGTG